MDMQNSAVLRPHIRRSSSGSGDFSRSAMVMLAQNSTVEALPKRSE